MHPLIVEFDQIIKQYVCIRMNVRTSNSVPGLQSDNKNI